MEQKNITCELRFIYLFLDQDNFLWCHFVFVRSQHNRKPVHFRDTFAK